MTRHVWAREHLVSYLAGGLTTEERYQLQEQLKSDAELAGQLDELRGLDERLRTLFAAARPPVTLEDRVIRSLRQRGAAAPREWKMPSTWFAIAATFLLVFLFGIVSISSLGSNANKTFAIVSETVGDGESSSITDMRAELSGLPRDSGGYRSVDRLEELEVARIQERTPTDAKPPVIFFGRSAATKEAAKSEPKSGSALKRGWAFEEKKSEPYYEVPGVDGNGSNGFTYDTRDAFIRPPADQPQPSSNVIPPVNAPSLTLGLPVLPVMPPSPPPPSGEADGERGRESGVAANPNQKTTSPSAPNQVRLPQIVPSEGVPLLGATPFPSTIEMNKKYVERFTDGSAKPAGDNKAGEVANGISELKKQDTAEKADDSKKIADEDDKGDKVESLERAIQDNLVAQKRDDKQEKEPAKIDPKQADPKQPEPKLPTQKRVIIRSGDIEFEVESFDAAVGIINTLIGKTKGGVVANTNSEQLPNGKMRGTVVVRMPPEELDDFVAALRRDLGKAGELKKQKIGSQDVSKLYTDMESELRGLRISETRLIEMLKDAKAKLSDLLAVENQLAKTRTRIEQFEGELRFYANLAAMSTLKIELHEKHIMTAATIVESERVRAGVESEDVEKAFQEAKAAIAELKGRVFQSEMTQTAIGRYQATLQFEVAPEAAGPMRDRLRQIGVVARLDIDRLQSTEGGGKPSRESRVKRGDTQFEVVIYDLASYTPRETVNARIVSSDVAANYRAIRDLVAKVKGTLLGTALQNNDARNVFATLDFSIRRADEPVVLTALSNAGEFLSRTVQRAPEAANVTDTKIRFVIRLDSVTSITARESNKITLAALDVLASDRALRAVVLKVKGSIRNANLQENDRNNITATLDFDVLREHEAEVDAALLAAGEITSRRRDRRPESESVTDAKVNYAITMNSVATLTPRETVNITIAAPDVAAAFASLRETATKNEAQMQTANLTENDRRDINAQLDFAVLRVKDDVINTALAAAGEQLKRQVDRQASGAQLTDAKVQYRVRLVSTNTIEPREIRVMKIKVDRVEEKLKYMKERVKEAQGRIVDGPTVLKHPNGTTEARAKYLVPLSAASLIGDDFRKIGEVTGKDELTNPNAPDGKLALALFDVKLHEADLLVPGDEGFGAQLRNGISISLRGLSIAASFVIAALLFLAPWAIVGWVILAIMRRRNGRPEAEASQAAKT